MLPFSVVHVQFVSVECRILFSEVACCCLRLAHICRAPVCCYDASSTFERKRLGPLVCWRRKNTFWRNGMFGSTVFCSLEKSVMQFNSHWHEYHVRIFTRVRPPQKGESVPVQPLHGSGAEYRLCLDVFVNLCNLDFRTAGLIDFIYRRQNTGSWTKTGDCRSNTGVPPPGCFLEEACETFSAGRSILGSGKSRNFWSRQCFPFLH